MRRRWGQHPPPPAQLDVGRRRGAPRAESGPGRAKTPRRPARGGASARCGGPILGAEASCRLRPRACTAYVRPCGLNSAARTRCGLSRTAHTSRFEHQLPQDQGVGAVTVGTGRPPCPPCAERRRPAWDPGRHDAWESRRPGSQGARPRRRWRRRRPGEAAGEM